MHLEKTLLRDDLSFGLSVVASIFKQNIFYVYGDTSDYFNH